AASLRQITSATLLHAQEHRGYLPLAGELWGTPFSPSIPACFGDPMRRRYTYAGAPIYNGSPLIVPLPPALAVYIGYKGLPFDDWTKLDMALNEQLFWRRFQCAGTDSYGKARVYGNSSDTTLVGQGTMMSIVVNGYNPSAWSTNSDFALNEGVFGYHWNPAY